MVTSANAVAPSATQPRAGGSYEPDPYSVAKANLRDTVKWLAATFAALAAVVLAGSSVSGLGKLKPFTPEWWSAGSLLLLAFVFICLALAITVSLLRSDVLYVSDLDPDSPLQHLGHFDRREVTRLRVEIDQRAADVLPPNYESLAVLMGLAKRRRNALKAASRQLREATLFIQKEAARGEIVKAQRQMGEVSAALARVLSYAIYIRFYDRIRRAMPWLFGLGIAALIALAGFGVLVQVPDKPLSAPTVIVNNLPAPTLLPAAIDLPRLESVEFDTGSAELRPPALVAIGRAQAALRQHPRALLLLEAHTDTQAGPRTNGRLARKRAQAVRAALLGEGGVEPARVFVAELPETALPKLTAQEADEGANRVVSLRLVLGR